ncbi:hypothetical protein N0B44_34230, partial [Roseibacterium beibuensis]|nr:hypothetical protein [Roseibacterium beibuensis]
MQRLMDEDPFLQIPDLESDFVFEEFDGAHVQPPMESGFLQEFMGLQARFGRFAELAPGEDGGLSSLLDDQLLVSRGLTD